MRGKSEKIDESKVKVIEDDVFEVGPIQNAAPSTESLLNIADYVQVKTQQ